MIVIMILGFLITSMLFQETFRRHKWLSWAVFLILPIGLLPWWIIHEEHSFFGWLKLYSVTLSVSWFMAFRSTTLSEKKWAYYIVFMALTFNILEAVILDIAEAYYANYINAAAGVLLIITLPGLRSISLDKESAYHDLAWDIPIGWIIGYTIWNIVFVYLQTPQHMGMHAAILGAALIVGFINNKLWIQARAYTLGIFLMLFFTYKPMFDVLRTPEITNEGMALVGVVISLGWMIVHLVRILTIYTRPGGESRIKRPA